MSEGKPTITVEDFSKLDIRIGTILSAERVPETDKLIKFEIDFGSEKRQIIGGFAPSYPDPAALVGTQVPVLVNLEPRTMRGFESQGMILAAAGNRTTNNGEEILAASNQQDGPVALHPELLVEPGTPIR